MCLALELENLITLCKNHKQYLTTNIRIIRSQTQCPPIELVYLLVRQFKKRDQIPTANREIIINYTYRIHITHFINVMYGPKTNNYFTNPNPITTFNSINSTIKINFSIEKNIVISCTHNLTYPHPTYLKHTLTQTITINRKISWIFRYESKKLLFYKSFHSPGISMGTLLWDYFTHSLSLFTNSLIFCSSNYLLHISFIQNIKRYPFLVSLYIFHLFSFFPSQVDKIHFKHSLYLIFWFISFELFRFILCFFFSHILWYESISHKDTPIICLHCT